MIKEIYEDLKKAFNDHVFWGKILFAGVSLAITISVLIIVIGFVISLVKFLGL